MTDANPDPAPPVETARPHDAAKTAEPTVAQLVQQVTEESSRLVRTELKLAQAEMTAKAKTAGIGLGAFGAAGILALYGIGCLILTGVYALSLVLPTWAAALIVGVIVLAAAGVAALVGKKKVAAATPPVPEHAVENVKADVAEIKERVRR